MTTHHPTSILKTLLVSVLVIGSVACDEHEAGAMDTGDTASVLSRSLPAAIPAKGTLECGQGQTIHINATENEQRCTVDYENTCGRSTNLFSNGIRLDLRPTLNNNTASASLNVPAGKRLEMNCCAHIDDNKYCTYEITSCVTLEDDADADAK